MFAATVFGTLLVIFLVFVAIGRWHPRRASDIWDKDRDARLETQAGIEAGDIKQMVAAQNRMRERHGKPPLSEVAIRRLAAAQQRKGLEKARRERSARSPS
jgi:hypothetical protein